jgi:hypothetical protein
MENTTAEKQCMAREFARINNIEKKNGLYPAIEVYKAHFACSAKMYSNRTGSRSGEKYRMFLKSDNSFYRMEGKASGNILVTELGVYESAKFLGKQLGLENKIVPVVHRTRAAASALREGLQEENAGADSTGLLRFTYTSSFQAHQKRSCRWRDEWIDRGQTLQS